MSDIFKFMPHPRIAARREAGPPKVADVVVPEATYEDADAVLHTSLEIQKHLETQDAEIETILAEVRRLRTA